MNKICLIFVLLLVTISCKKAEEAIPEGFGIYFENPQPINDSELSKFPNRLIGLYMSADSIFIRVDKNIVLSESYTRFRFHKNAMDSIKKEFEFVNGNYVFKLDNRIYTSKKLKDSIEFSTKYVDTLFIFSNKQKAKLLHTQLVLSTKDSIFWTIKTMKLSDNKLTIKTPYSDTDIKRMDSITKLHSIMLDSSSYLFKPSRPEFIKFIKLKHFGFDQEYKKLNR